MANSSHVARLRVSAEAWNLWRSAPANRGEAPDLAGANLVGANLRKANLAGINLRGADLTEAELAGADLQGSDLRQARLTGADLQGADLSNANLSEADLCGADLGRATLSCANMRLCDLSAADLSAADLRGASMSGAVLKEATLAGANLGDAGLFGCNLNGADLDGCSFNDADLSEADFCGAVAVGCSFGSNDLSRTHGLDRVVHLGPSSVATSTLKATAEALGDDAVRQAQVEAFLRGCGVERDFLDGFRAMIGRPPEFHACFVVHDAADIQFAQKLHDALEARGATCWLDPRGPFAGSLRRRARQAAPKGARTVLCCSSASLAWPWVAGEIDAAVEKEKALLRRTRAEVRLVVAVTLDGALRAWNDPHAAALGARAVADFSACARDPGRFDEEVGRVAEVLRVGSGSLARRPSA